MGVCDASSFAITITVTVVACLIWLWWKPHVDDIYKFFLKIPFAAIVWNHIYVSWIAGEIADRWPYWYQYFPQYEWAVNLLPMLFTVFVLDAMGMYLALFASAAVIVVVTRHIALGLSLGVAFVAGLVLHFAMRAHTVKRFASILTVSLLCSVVLVSGGVSLAVHDQVSSAFSLHRLPNTFTSNDTLPLQRGGNCTTGRVNLFLVCDSNCPDIYDIPEQPAIAGTAAGVIVACVVLRVFGILVVKGYKDQKREKAEEEEGEKEPLDEEEKPVCFRLRLCCTCWRCARRQQQQQGVSSSGVGAKYGRLPFTDVS